MGADLENTILLNFCLNLQISHRILFSVFLVDFWIAEDFKIWWLWATLHAFAFDNDLGLALLILQMLLDNFIRSLTLDTEVLVVHLEFLWFHYTHPISLITQMLLRHFPLVKMLYSIVFAAWVSLGVLEESWALAAFDRLLDELVKENVLFGWASPFDHTCRVLGELGAALALSFRSGCSFYRREIVATSSWEGVIKILGR